MSSSSASAPPSSASGTMDVQSFIASTTALVALERSAEVEEESSFKSSRSIRELERAGVLLNRLVVTDTATGLYGRCLLTLENARGGPLAQSELGVRDIVELASHGGGGSSGQSAASGSSGGSAAGGSKIASGVVYRLKETSITLVLDEFLDPAQRQGTMSILKLSNQVTYDRYKYGLDCLQREFAGGGSSGAGISSRLLRVLYTTEEAPAFSSRQTQWIPFSSSLNASQKEAIQQALDANDVYMIHGPPGTGKTTTLVELIRQFVSRGLRVLACAPSNLAVDNLVEKLGVKLPYRTGKQTVEQSQAVENLALGNVPSSSSAAFDAALAAASSSSLSNLQNNRRGFDIRLCRLGHPARITPAVLGYTLDSVVASSDAEAVCSAMRSDMAAANKAIDKSKDRSERNALRKEVRELQRALRAREKEAVTESLKKTEVIACTLVNAGSKLLDMFNSNSNQNQGGSAGTGVGGFDVVVIDEAAQALEVACLLPLLKGRKLILAGDNKQLGPTVKSADAVKGGLDKTLFDRLYGRPSGKEITTMLTEQYRMNGTIMKWSSQEMYGGRLVGPPSITSHLLCDLPGVKSTEDTRAAFIVVDTAGLGMYEDEQTSASSTSSNNNAKNPMVLAQQRSKSNKAESLLVKQHLDSLLAAGVSAKDIGIITPYNGQVSLLRELLLEEYGSRGLEIGTVDGFQGREKEAILLSLVRSNDEHEVGFLREDRRLNVAITRARRHVCVVLDSDTVSSHPFLGRMIDFVSEHGEYRMAVDPNEVRADLSGATTSPATKDGEEIKDDGSLPTPAPQHHPAVVSKPKAKKERVRSAQPSSASEVAFSSAASSVASSHTVQPVEEEWSRLRIESLCSEILRRGRFHSAGPPSVPDPRTIYEFPPSLNSFERHLVHEVAENIGGDELSHEATGQGMERFIQLKYVWPKKLAKEAVADAPAAAATAEDADAEEDTDTAAPPSSSLSGLSKKQAKKLAKKSAELAAAQAQQNAKDDARQAAAARDASRRKALDAMELKATGKVSAPAAAAAVCPIPSAASVPTPAAATAASAPAPQASGFAALSAAAEDEFDDNDAAAADEEDTSSAPASSATPAAGKGKKARKKKGADSAAAATASASSASDPVDDDAEFDSMLSEFSSTTCKFAGCSARVVVMGFLCSYCKEKFCVKHMNPTLHGCALAHKEFQRGQMASAHKSAQSSAPKYKDSDKALIQAKLDKKIAADKLARTKQLKKGEEKKK